MTGHKLWKCYTLHLMKRTLTKDSCVELGVGFGSLGGGGGALHHNLSSL